MSLSSPHHSFDVHLATEFSIEEAIMIHHFQHWLMVNAKVGQNFHKGRYWTYQTLEWITAHFPYWSYDQVRRVLKKLQDKGVLLKGNFSPDPMKTVVWYSLKDEYLAKSPSHMAKSPDGVVESPDVYKDTDTKERTYTEDKREREPPPLAFGKWVKLTQSELDGLIETFGKERVDLYIQKINDYISSHGKKPYKDYAATIRNWVTNDSGRSETPLKSINEENRRIALELVKNTKGRHPHGQIEALAQYIEITFNGNAQSFTLRYDENGFKDRLSGQLRKMNMLLNGQILISVLDMLTK